jgi:hypothetical protein
MDELARALVPIASDPARTKALYHLLGDYCHAIRNRLNCLKIGLYLARLEDEQSPQPAWDKIESVYGGVERFVQQLQSVCRPLSLAPIQLTVGTLLEDRRPSWDRRLEPRGLHLNWTPPAREATGTFDPMRLGDALDTLVDWRADKGPSGATIELSWGAVAEYLTLNWLESKPSTARAEEMQPASLALPILTRVLSAHGGALRLRKTAAFGVELRWPINPLRTGCPEPPAAQFGEAGP